MSKQGIALISIAVIATALFVIYVPKKYPHEIPAPIAAPTPEPPSESVPDEPISKVSNPLVPIDSIHDPRLLRNYGSEQNSIVDDLALVDNVLGRFWLLFKNPDLLRVGSNEDILSSLTGNNPDGIRFVSPKNDFIDDQGRLLDRWGTPLFFHPESLTDIEIRSAGPDKRLFTSDDTIVGSQMTSLKP